MPADKTRTCTPVEVHHSRARHRVTPYTSTTNYDQLVVAEPHFRHDFAQFPPLDFVTAPCYAGRPAYPLIPPFGHERPHYSTPAPVLHNFGWGPTPLFGWESVMPLNHSYGQPGYIRRVKPDYRRFCFSVGKADVPYAALPGGPLQGYPTTMAPQLVGRW